MRNLMPQEVLVDAGIAERGRYREGTSEIQRMIIGTAVTGLDVR